MSTPIFLNTGGGVFGAIRQRIANDANLRAVFGDRIRPGRLRGGQGDFPCVVLSHVTGTLDDLFTDVAPQGQVEGDRYDVWKESIQVSVYTDNYEATRQLGRLLHIRLSRQTLLADCVEITLFPDTRLLREDPEMTSSGADVWHYDFKYHFWTADKLAPSDRNEVSI